MTNKKPFDTEDLEKEIEYERIKGGIIKPKGRPRKKDIRYSDEQFIRLEGRKGVAMFGILLAKEKLQERQRLRKEVEKVIDDFPFTHNEKENKAIRIELKTHLGISGEEK